MSERTFSIGITLPEDYENKEMQKQEPKRNIRKFIDPESGAIHVFEIDETGKVIREL